MNQNSNQGVRQVTPEEIAKVEGIPLTQEELQKTQVLNLKEFIETVHFEKLTSKKPAFIIAIVGVLLIAFGTTFQLTKSFSSPKAVEPRNAPAQEPQEIQKPTTLSCTQTFDNDPEGTDAIYNMFFNFEDEKLIGYKKTYSLSIKEGSETGPASVQNFINAIQPLNINIDGYAVDVTSTNNGLVATVTVDYYKLDLTQVPEAQQGHFLTKINFPLYTPYSDISTTLTGYGYTCE